MNLELWMLLMMQYLKIMKSAFTSNLLTMHEINSAIYWLIKHGKPTHKASLKKVLECDFYHNKIGRSSTNNTPQ
jgi:hypothetical protein